MIEQSKSQHDEFIAALCHSLEDTLLKLSGMKAEMTLTSALDQLYPLINADEVIYLRSLTKKPAQSFINAVMATFGRAGFQITKLEAQTLFAMDPASRLYSDSNLPDRANQRNLFSNLSKPIELHEIVALGIVIEPEVMNLIINGKVCYGKGVPLQNQFYTVFQLMRDPFNPEDVLIRGESPVVERSKIHDRCPEGVYFKENRNEIFSYKDKTLIFILEPK